MNVTILGGAGLMGAGILRDLLSDLAIVPIDVVRICDTSMARMSALAERLDDPRIQCVDVDVTDPAQLKEAIVGEDLCINAVPTLAGHQMTIFAAALDAGVSYVDLGGLGTYTVQQLAWHERFRDAGVTAVLGVGSDPGMSNVICRAVADELDDIDRINLYWAAELVGPESPVLVPPYSLSTVLAEYAHPSTQFLGGKHVQCEPMTGHEVLELPEPWGRCEFMYSPHSEQLTVPLAEDIRKKGIKEFTWKLHLPRREHEAWVGLVKAGFGDFDTPVQIDGMAVKPLEVLAQIIGRHIDTNRQRIPQQDSHEIHLAIAHGRRAGRPASARCQVIVRPGLRYVDYVDACTSMNASIAAQLILARPRKPGVFAPESYFTVADYLPELEKRGFEVTTTVAEDASQA